MFNDIYKNKRILITGHTGFKGSWLSLWLKEMGAIITGFSLDPPTDPNHFDILKIDIDSVIGDIRNFNLIKRTIEECQPEIIFHLAAQPLVTVSYKNPIETFEVNVLGTLNLLEASRTVNSIKGIINVTTDKCYENHNWPWGYREIDRLGGHDPYSASKACSELVTSSMRDSFFSNSKTLISSVRAGNVIGGGDWAKDRLIPDIIRSIMAKKTLEIRHPKSTRPWQHVLEPLSGYLCLGEKLLEEKKDFADAWNFGPNYLSEISVEQIVLRVKDLWDSFNYLALENKTVNKEANYLKLDSSKAMNQLHWNAVWDMDKSIEQTINWYKNYYSNNHANSLSDLYEYIKDAKNKNIEWTK